MPNWLGLTLSYLFVFLAIGVSTLLLRLRILSASGARKLVHIGVSNWWILAMVSMDNPWIASIGPLTFIALNLVSLKTGLFSAMEQGKPERNWGTVYFPISLLVLVNVCYRGVFPLYVGGIGTLIMGWGDGLAAVIGGRHGKRKIGFGKPAKSVAGSLTMFVVSAAVTALFSLVFDRAAPLWKTAVVAPLATASVATAVELFTPWGLDNLTVPLLSAAFYRLLFVPLP